MSGRLSGKITVVSGANSGIGRGIAVAFGREGATVICANRRAESAAPGEKDITTNELIEKNGGKAEFVRMSFSETESVNECVRAVVEKYGRIDVWVNNAGTGTQPGPVWEYTDEQFDEAIDTNLKGTFKCIRAASAQMIKQEPDSAGLRGRIINICSVFGPRAIPMLSGYSASKAGVMGLIRAAAADLSPYKITINAISPGTVETGLTENIPDEMRQFLKTKAIMGFGKPEDIAGPALLLASDEGRETIPSHINKSKKKTISIQCRCAAITMKKFQARRERQHQEAIVGSIEIEDPSAELFSASRSWQSDDPLQDSFLEHSEPTPPAKEEHFRLPKLKFNRTLEGDLSPFDCSPTFQDDVSDTQQEDEIQKSADVPAPLFTQPAAYVAIMPPSYSSEPEVVSERESSMPPAIPQKNPNRTTPLPIRSRSLPPSRDISSLSVSPPKTNFQVFSQRCAPSPTSASPLATSPVFELSAEDVMFSLAGSIEADSPVELEGSPVDSKTVYTVPLHYEPMHAMEQEPEASPYNRFTALAKSIHTLNANLSPIEETEEEAASRRSSMAKIYELPGTLPPTSFAASAYSGGTTITPRSGRYLPNTMPDTISIPMRTTSMRSYDSANSTNSAHSMFSFEFTNSDTEKIYIVPCSRRRESSAPSLTDVSSVDDFDVDLELNPRRSRSVTKSDVKLERFFGIRQFSVSTSSDLSPTTSSSESPASSTESVYERERGRTSLSIDDLELSLALENDPYRREIIAIHKSILSKSQSKQDAKLEKFFGCDKDEIQVARKSSTGSRLAGCTDDLKYRSIGW